MKRVAKIGGRNSGVVSDNYKMFHPGTTEILIGTSKLVVVDSFLYGCGFSDLCLTESVHADYISSNWSTNVIDRLEKGKLDIAIFNKELSNKYISEKNYRNVRAISDIGHSMGGKCFSVVAHNSNKIDVDYSNILSAFENRIVFIGVKSDRFANFCSMLNLTEAQAHSSNITFIDIPDPDSLEILGLNKEAILVGGQNIRFSAQQNGDFEEIIDFNRLPTFFKRKLFEASQNTILVSNALENKMIADAESLVSQLTTNFDKLRMNAPLYDKLVDKLKHSCSFPEGLEDSETIIKHVIFETYRHGNPQW